MARKQSFTHPIYIHRSHWENMNEEELEEFATWIFNYYRNERGFPYYEYDMEGKKKEFDKLIKKDYREILDGKTIKQVMTGLGLAWCYFPHSWNVRCHNFKTPWEVFNDDKAFMNAIRKGRLKRGGFITDAGVRKSLRSTGTQAVSNFRPTAAGAIYEHYAGDGVVWDMSSGFGGRLLGALTSKAVKVYIGTDPSTKTYEGLKEMKKDFFNLYDSDKKVKLIKLGSENYLPNESSLDLCFTSPPYFNVEQYSNEETQSYIKFPKIDKWLEGFLGRTIKNCVHGLKDGGYLIINIDNVITYPELRKDSLRILKAEKQLVPVTRLSYILSNVAKGGYKSEFIYVFRVTK